MVERRSRRLPDLAWWEVAGTGAPARRASLPEGSPRLSELDGLNAHTWELRIRGRGGRIRRPRSSTSTAPSIRRSRIASEAGRGEWRLASWSTRGEP